MRSGQCAKPSTRRDNLARHYEQLESRLPVTDREDYELLVVPNGNAQKAVHRWFHLKEAFSRKLLTRVLKDTSLATSKTLRVIDPFSGGGTTAVSLAELVGTGDLEQATFYGMECNPFLHLVSSAKLHAFQKRSPTFGAVARAIAAAASRRTVEAAPIPGLSTFSNPVYFDPDDLDLLLRLRAAVDQAERQGADALDIELARLCLGATAEPVSGLRRDGRALRYTPQKNRARPVKEFLRRAEQVEEDLPLERIRLDGAVHRGDGRSLDRLTRIRPVDLVIFSPPYPNNIDYSEVYKIESWLLGFVTSKEEFANLRRSTVYSHPSIQRPVLRTASASHAAEIRSIVEPILEAVPDDRYRTGRCLMIEGYAHDMYATLSAARRRLKPDGHLVYIVGNSVHGRGEAGFVIAADLVIAALAELAGLVVESLEIARGLRRRTASSRFLRESVVFCRRPLDR